MLDTTFLRFVAILLITNSHLDKLYPVAAMSIGGQLGNSLFFMLSGFGLAASYRKKGDAFWPWLQRRLSRIYPSVLLIAMAAAVITRTVFEWGVVDYVRHLVWPTDYWFVSAIVCFYVPFYWFMAFGRKAIFLLMIGVLCVPYFYFYWTALDLSQFSIEGGGYFKWIFYFQVMLLGGYLAYRDDASKPPVAMNWNAMLLGLFVVVYFGLKFMVAKGIQTELQFLIHWMTFPIMVISLFAMNARVVKETIMKSAISPFIALVAGATLEIYLLQRYVYGNPYISAMEFPVNVAVFWPVVIAGAILISWVSARGSRYLAEWLRPVGATALGRGGK